MTIFVEKNELMDAAARMDATIRSMAQIREAISRIDNNAASSWQGRASAQNTENFTALNETVSTYIADAGLTKTALDLAVNAYKETEDSQVAKVERLGTQGIF